MLQETALMTRRAALAKLWMLLPGAMLLTLAMLSETCQDTVMAQHS